MSTICAQPGNKDPATTWPHKDSHDLNDVGMTELMNINRQLQQKVLEYEQTEKEKMKLLHELGERNKELRCLYGFSRIIEQDRVSIDEFCRRVVDLILPAWQYPEITCARLILEDKEFRSDNFKVTSWRQSADLRLLGKRIGEIEVYYLEEKAEIDEGPFLKEERNLLEAIAERLGRVFEHKKVVQEIETLAMFPGENANPVLRISEEGTIMYCNAASLPVLKSWGCGAGQSIPGHWQRLIKSALSSGQVEQVEIEYCDRTFSLTLVPIVEADYVNVYGLDITQCKQAENGFKLTEEALRESEHKLLHAQKMEAIGMLTGGIAHDFNNLLTAMIGYCDLTLMESDLSETVTANINEIRKSAERAASLTQQLLAFSRRQVLEPRIINLNSLITNLENMLRRLIGEDVVLTTNLSHEEVIIRADPGQIEQVIMNLAVNARDAMPDIGKLVIETRVVVLDENYCSKHPDIHPGSYVLLAVSDTGHGMSEETQKRIFEPFFTTKELGKGTGLGLSTTFGIVKQSGGNIEVHSELEIGTTFKTYLPLVDRPDGDERIEPLEIISVEGVEGAETLLLVEDDKEMRKLIKRLLSELNYTVFDFGDGKEALDFISNSKTNFELLITDVIMPNMNGRVLAENVKNKIPEMKVLYVSGYTDDIIAPHGVLDRGVCFLPKPFTLQSLAQKVRSVLNGRD